MNNNSGLDKSQQITVIKFKEIVIDELIELDSSLKAFKDVV